MDRRKGLQAVLRGLLFALAVSLAVALSAYSFIPPAYAAASWPIVGQGASGENVFSIQYMLQGHGYSLTADGLYGPQTASTVASFQSAHGLSADGVVGPQTWPVLIITTSQGSSGSAVVALQRQLNAHGASLTVDGSFGPLTASAVRSFQSSHGLGVDGIAGPQTWQALVGTSIPPPPPPPPGKVLWGVDSVSPITSSFLGQIENNLGKPQVVGRYLDYSPGLSASEASYIHSQGIYILPIYSDHGGDVGYNTGSARANSAISEARAVGAPKGTTLIADIENNSSIDAGYIQGWYNTIAGAGYTPGYYENPYPGSSGFNGAFCGAISGDASVANALLWSDEPSGSITTRANAPTFAPSGLLCNGQDRGGHTRLWQYAIQGNYPVNVDTDEVQSSVPLW